MVGRLRAVPLALGFALILTTPVAAAEPVIITGAFSDPGSPDSGLCGFPIVLSFEGTFRITLFYDNAGNLLGGHLHSNDVGTATNPATGTTLTGHEVVTIVADFVNGIEAHVGLPLHFNVTGGSALVDAGRIVINESGQTLFVGGNHEFLEGDLAGFCAALA
jgi:hypothetical protein